MKLLNIGILLLVLSGCGDDHDAETRAQALEFQPDAKVFDLTATAAVQNQWRADQKIVDPCTIDFSAFDSVVYHCGNGTADGYYIARRIETTVLPEVTADEVCTTRRWNWSFTVFSIGNLAHPTPETPTGQLKTSLQKQKCTGE